MARSVAPLVAVAVLFGGCGRGSPERPDAVGGICRSIVLDVPRMLDVATVAPLADPGQRDDALRLLRFAVPSSALGKVPAVAQPDYRLLLVAIDDAEDGDLGADVRTAAAVAHRRLFEGYADACDLTR